MAEQQFFDDATAHQFEEEDRRAWYQICGILLGIIAVGLMLAFTAVWLVSEFPRG